MLYKEFSSSTRSDFSFTTKIFRVYTNHPILITLTFKSDALIQY